MSDEQSLQVGKKIYAPSHVFGSGQYEVKEYEVMSRNDEKAVLKHTKTFAIPSGHELDGTDEVLEITSNRFPYFEKPLIEKFSDSIELIDLVCAQTLNLKA